MKKSIILAITAITLTVGCGASVAAEGEAYKINPNPPTDGHLGSNYTPAYASSPIQFWHDFRPEVVKKELAAAKKYLGYTTLRVYVNTTNYFEDNEKFLKNLETFLTIADKNGIRPGIVFFSGDHRADGAVYLQGPYEPIKGHHNGRWPSCPQEHEWDKINPDDFSKFKPYIEDIIKKYRTDKRILFWEIHNEPPEGDKKRDKLKRVAYKWAKDLKPTQPVINCEKKGLWGDCDASDIVDGHVYIAAWGWFDGIIKQNVAKGAVFTEAGARWKAIARNHGEPTDVVAWLEHRRKAKQSTPGVYLNWELMVGNSNCRFHWRDNGYRNKKPDPEPEIPWCGMLWPDATPVALAESHACLMYATGKSPALFYDSFHFGTKKWKTYGYKNPRCRHAITVGHKQKIVAGDPKWTDYIVEARVLPKIHWKRRGVKVVDYSKIEGPLSAGLLFRVNEPGDEYEDMRAYAVTFNSDKKLALGKFENKKYKELASFDATTLGTRARMIEWSQIRVEGVGNKIKVYFNRFHGDKAKGLRIEYTDTDNPILSGAIGAISYKTDALYDNVVVMPVDKK